MSLEVSPTTGFQYLFKNINENIYEKSRNPIIFAVLISVILIYVVIFNYLGITHNVPEAIKSGPGLKMIELLLWAVFLFLNICKCITILF